MTSELEEISEKTRLDAERLADAMDTIYANDQMKALWKMYQDFIDNDPSYKFSSVEKLELQVFGTMYLRSAKVLGEMTDEDLKEALSASSSPFARLSDMSNRVERLRLIAKERAEKTGETGGKSPFNDPDVTKASVETDKEKVTFTREKKESVDDNDYEELE